MNLPVNECTWPSQRSSRSAIEAQFGVDRAELLLTGLTTGDPLADAVVASIHTNGRSVRNQLQAGIANGLASLEDPDAAVAALLAQTESIPEWVDMDLYENGPKAWYTIPFPLHLVSLSAGALVRVYASKSIATVLDTTGRLVDGASRRIIETGQWVATALLPGGLKPGRPGYVATLQVRMLHAHMRHAVLAKGYDPSTHGTPICQIDLARTYLDFTLTSMKAEEEVGYGLTIQEQGEIYRYWWHLGYLLGIGPEFIHGISTNDQAARIDEMFEAVTGEPVAESVRLTDATLAAITETLAQQLHVPGVLPRHVLDVLARRFHGDAMSDNLAIKRHTGLDKAIGPVIRAARDRRSKLRLDPVAWEAARLAEVEGALARAGETSDGQTAYQAEAAGALDGHQI